MDIHIQRRARLATWMAQNGIAVVILEDTERRRDPAIRYFTGHPGDALFAVCVDGKSMLSPWDVHMAEKYAHIDAIIPYSEFERRPVQAAVGFLTLLKVPNGSRVEIPNTTPYPMFLRYVDALSKFDVLCRENGSHDEISAIRSIKDEDEMLHIRTATNITDQLIESIEKNLINGKIKTETDVALFIEKEARILGCEGTGFDTLAAGPSRSFGIHCFPSYTAGEFGTAGFSILDFGVKIEGYTSDVTLTVARGSLSNAQEKQLTLVEKAYAGALELYKPGLPTIQAAKKADDIFAKAKQTMPHALGHGIGLEAHEAPSIRSRADNIDIFKPGMVVTLEPGLYDPKNGGCRLENDILITETGNEVLTHSKIIRLE